MPDTQDLFEVVVVVASLYLLAGTIVPVGEAASTLWPGGVLHAVTSVLATVVGGNLDIPVALVTGLACGWFLLFIVDGTKRVQAFLVAVVVGTSAVPLFERTDRILDTVARMPSAFVVGLVVGLVSGGVASVQFYGLKRPSSLRELFRWIQFPAATGALFYLITTVVVVTAVNYAAVASGLLPRLRVLGASAVLVFCLTVFTKYNYRRRIVALSPPDEREGKYHPYVIGGLYAHATDHHHGFPLNTQSDTALARTLSSPLPPRLQNDVAFGFVSSAFGALTDTLGVPQTWFSRTAVVESQSWTTDQLGDVGDRYDQADSDIANRLLMVWRWILHHLQLAVVPLFLRDSGFAEGDVLSRLDHADTILLIAPTPRNGAELPRGIETYADLCDRYAASIGTDVVIATTDARSIADSKGLRMTATQFLMDIESDLDVDRDECTLVPVDRFGPDGDQGFDQLLDEITN